MNDRQSSRCGDAVIMRALEGVEYVVFDMNGVLVDDEMWHFEAFRSVVMERGCGLQLGEYLQHCAGRSDEEGMRELCAVNLVDGDIGTLIDAKARAYLQIKGRSAMPAAQGAIDLARSLGKVASCFLVTSGDASSVEALISGSRLEDVFPVERQFVRVSAVERIAIYRKLVEHSGRPDACAVIDDSPRNLASARDLGMRTIGVATTHPESALVADVVVRDLR